MHFVKAKLDHVMRFSKLVHDLKFVSEILIGHFKVLAIVTYNPFSKPLCSEGRSSRILILKAVTFRPYLSSNAGQENKLKIEQYVLLSQAK